MVCLHREAPWVVLEEAFQAECMDHVPCERCKGCFSAVDLCENTTFGWVTVRLRLGLRLGLWS